LGVDLLLCMSLSRAANRGRRPLGGLVALNALGFDNGCGNALVLVDITSRVDAHGAAQVRDS